MPEALISLVVKGGCSCHYHTRKASGIQSLKLPQDYEKRGIFARTKAPPGLGLVAGGTSYRAGGEEACIGVCPIPCSDRGAPDAARQELTSPQSSVEGSPLRPHVGAGGRPR